MPTYADITGATLQSVMPTPGVADRSTMAHGGMQPPPAPTRQGAGGFADALANPGSPIPWLFVIIAVAYVVGRKAGLIRGRKP